jgi:hypothetical protein
MKNLLFTVLLALSCLVANAQWSDNPAENNRITPLGTEIYDCNIGTSNDGASFITFNRPMGGNVATFLQIVDVNGNKLFSDDGMMVSNKKTISWTQVNELMFVDDDGNVIISVSDCRNSAGEDLSYTLYKVSPTGEMLWGENGIDLCGGIAYELLACMRIIQLEDGNYVCAWSVYQGEDSYIQLQKISKTGTLLWNNIRIYEPSVINEYPYLANAGDNQVIVAYSRNAGSFGNRNIRARKIASDGSNVWANDLSIYSGWFGYVPLWVNMRVIPDQTGGAFVGWYDTRNNPNREDTYIAHVKANGTLGFNGVVGGVRIENSNLRSFFPEMYCDKEAGFLYVTWRDTNDTQSWQQLSAQKLEISSGTLLWGANGKIISPYTYNHSIAFYTIQGGGEDNVAVFFTANTYDPVYYYGWDINKITLLNSAGEYVWDDEIIAFSNPVSMKGNLLSTPLQFNAYWLTVWNDDRVVAGDPAGEKKLYMQRINLDGTLGDNGAVCFPPKNVVVEVDIHNYSTVVVSWEGEADNYEVSYCIVGEEWISEIVMGAHTYTVENLLPSTDYQVRVRSICSGDNVSDWSEIVPFTTFQPDPPCNAPVNLKATEITATSAKLSWKEGNDQNDAWELRYREASSSSWEGDEEPIQVKTYLLEGLTPNTAYIWTVRAFCSNTHVGFSPWAEENGFTTDQVGIDDVKKGTMTVYASGKMISVINSENRYIEKVQLFDITGRLLGNYTVKSTENVLIPTTINEMMVIVKIIGENREENHKVLVR